MKIYIREDIIDKTGLAIAALRPFLAESFNASVDHTDRRAREMRRGASIHGSVAFTGGRQQVEEILNALKEMSQVYGPDFVFDGTTISLLVIAWEGLLQEMEA